MRGKGVVQSVSSVTKGNSAEKGLFLSLCLSPIIDCVGDLAGHSLRETSFYCSISETFNQTKKVLYKPL